MMLFPHDFLSIWFNGKCFFSSWIKEKKEESQIDLSFCVGYEKFKFDWKTSINLNFYMGKDEWLDCLWSDLVRVSYSIFALKLMKCELWSLKMAWIFEMLSNHRIFRYFLAFIILSAQENSLKMSKLPQKIEILSKFFLISLSKIQILSKFSQNIMRHAFSCF